MPNYISNGMAWYEITPTQAEQAKTAPATVISNQISAGNRKKQD